MIIFKWSFCIDFLNNSYAMKVCPQSVLINQITSKVYYNGNEGNAIWLPNENIVETIAALNRKK